MLGPLKYPWHIVVYINMRNNIPITKRKTKEDKHTELISDHLLQKRALSNRYLGLPNSNLGHNSVNYSLPMLPRVDSLSSVLQIAVIS
jgi:hypothetical protein